ncbi:sensor histidine kinase [Hyunsoonleella sp. 2307UL5-6]|uniref:sensor histidine kinase n=1 Tax=Hyunsoonleella sp. 2307UL5-6 TaxID=3384768 RepID=UPI0039BCC817
MNLFDLRKNNKKLASATKHLETQNKFLEKFSGQVSHDLKSPLANISSLTDFLKYENEDKLTEDSKEYLDLINESATSLRQYIDGALKHYKASNSVENVSEDVSLKSIYNHITSIQNLKKRNFVLVTNAKLKQVKKSALTQILHNLVDNAFKYNNNRNPKVVLDFEETTSHYHFSVNDNGMGIKEEDIKKIFGLFSVSNLKDVFGNNASGIGLFTVKSMVKALGGDITLTSQVNVGSTFKFYIKK